MVGWPVARGRKAGHFRMVATASHMSTTPKVVVKAKGAMQRNNAGSGHERMVLRKVVVVAAPEIMVKNPINKKTRGCSSEHILDSLQTQFKVSECWPGNLAQQTIIPQFHPFVKIPNP